ncbi:MAG: DtxR family transcriptional regulator, Mn-dependent transcriptional regulator [Chloroflexota bacterium]|jgi:DtxR family Mn-dependent transcriptional regulator|nr:DtxR family transcriptional regulator, Mn-dependent transcriptional regulator [Chloroflexota bacterium]
MPPSHTGRQPQPGGLLPALQDYLKAIHRLTEGSGRQDRASTKAIAAELGVTAPSVSAMLDRMASQRLVDYVHYAGASLTPRGRRAALRVIRRHRLVELFLVRQLGLGWEEVHDEAERLEHVISDRLEAAIDAALGFPDRDPHGDAIPDAEGRLPARSFRTLWNAAPGAQVRIDRVRDMDPELLRHLGQAGIVPGAVVSVVSRESGGAIRLKIGRRRPSVIGREAAEQVYLDG